MEPGVGAADFSSPTELLANGANERIPSRGVRGVGPAEVTIEVAFVNEIRKSELLQSGRSRVSHRFRSRDRFY
jgi:hypothetical protein